MLLYLLAFATIWNFILCFGTIPNNIRVQNLTAANHLYQKKINLPRCFAMLCAKQVFAGIVRSIICVSVIGASAIAQPLSMPTKGIPKMDHFASAAQARHGKVWAIASAPNGLMYMAAEKGLLEYDGADWQIFKGSQGFTRSIAVASDSILYTGSDLDFGRWRRNTNGTFTYQSLYPFKQVVNPRNEEFWNIAILENKIAFGSKDNIYLLANEQITRVAAPDEITGCFTLGDTLYVSTLSRGLYVLQGSSLLSIATYPDGISLQTKGLYRQQQALVAVTQNQGLWQVKNGRLIPLQNQLSEKLATDKVFSFTQLPDGSLAFGTIFDGLFCTAPDYQILQHINKRKGLPNNTILGLHYSKTGRLWASMDVGLSAIDISGANSYLIDYAGNFGTARAASLDNGLFYLGTNQGLFAMPWERLNGAEQGPQFDLIPGSEGQVWTIRKIGSQLMVGHDRGLFRIEGKKFVPLESEAGVWTLLQTDANHMLAGYYNGISIYNLVDGQWVFHKKMAEIAGSCNQLLLQRDSILWINIPNYGIIRASLNKDLQPLGRTIFPDSIFCGSDIRLQASANTMELWCGNEIFTYKEAEGRFIAGRKLIPDITVDGIVNEQQQAEFLDSQYSFIPIHNGFALQYRPGLQAVRQNVLSPMLRQIAGRSDQEEKIFQPTEPIPFSYNDLELKVVVPQFPDAEFRYRLPKLDTAWSNWQRSNIISLLNMNEGNYTVEIMSKVNGIPGDTMLVPLTIRPPWYRSWYGYTSYLIIAGMLVYGVRRRLHHKLQEQRRHMLEKQKQMLRDQAEKHHQKLMELQQQQLIVEKEQLAQQLKTKTIELATKAKDNADKANLLEKIKASFEEGLANPGRAKVKWAEIQRLLEYSEAEEDKVFEIQMDELHQEFFKVLKDKFEDLSVYDLRLCAYLKIGLSSAEIADLLKVQPSSVYISRSRLRKKLHLGSDEDLHGFLNHI